MMGNILITGSSGMLGASLTRYLKKSNYKVISHANSRQADSMFDLTDQKSSYRFFEDIKPSLIINLAGLTNVDVCEENVNLAYLQNTCTVNSIVNWIETSRTGCHLIHISTDQVYDGLSYNKEGNVNITNNYALSKFAGELAALRIPSTILRTNFVGRSEASHRVSMSDWIYSSAISGNKIELLNDVYFSPLSIVNLVEMIELVIQEKPLGIYNLGSRAGMSKADFAFSFAEYLRLPTNTFSRINIAEARFFKAYRPRNMRMDCSKFETIFSLELPSLNEVIQQIAQEYNDKT